MEALRFPSDSGNIYSK
uniref:Uncharacterized protein n=1 Tax=Rhizophora mucronata TaxID=61149 RepID=A0A2P2PTI7_RHIMU